MFIFRRVLMIIHGNIRQWPTDGRKRKKLAKVKKFTAAS